MDLDTQSIKEQHCETQRIEHIDANGYLVNNEDSINESDRQNDVDDVNLECDEEDNSDDSILGRVFHTFDDAYTFYNQYAFVHGFGIRIHWDYKNKTTNEVYRKMYVCNKQGFKRLKNDSSFGSSKKRRRDLRTGCEAHIRISKTKDDKWIVDRFSDVHNHDLINTPTKVMKHHSHGKFHRSMACKSLMSELGDAGLRPSQIKKVVNAMKSPYEANVTSKQCVDILREQHKEYNKRVLWSY